VVLKADRSGVLDGSHNLAKIEAQMLDDDIPESWADWPQGVRDAVQQFHQGDVVASPPLIYFGDPQSAVCFRTKQLAEAGALEPEPVWVTSPPFGMLTSQTCDIAEEDSKRGIKPWVQVAPVFDASGVELSQRGLIVKNRFMYLIHLPALSAVRSGLWVADLRIEVPVEKGWLASQQRLAGFVDEESRRCVGQRLAWIRGRPALGKALVDWVQRPLDKALAELKRMDPERYAALILELAEVGIEADSLLFPSRVRLVLMADDAFCQSSTEWLQEWWDGARELAEGAGLTLQPLEFATAATMSVQEYKRLVVIPLGRHSPDD